MVASREVSRLSARLVPARTLADVFGPGIVYTGRRSPTLPGWSPTAPGYMDYQSGNQLAVAGAMPCVASSGVLTPPALALLADAGVPVEADLHVYRTEAEYVALLHRLAARGLRLATQRAHTAEEVSPEAALVPPGLQRDLNDKGRMEDVVPAGWLAPRRVIEVADLPPAEDLLAGGEPAVLKAATPLPSGGGHCVWICRVPADLEAARAALSGERFVVIEEFLRIRRSACVHAVVLPDGAAALAGVAEEICDPNGRWLGNWLDAGGDALPPEVPEVVLRIARAAAARGYRGIVGIDVAFPEGGPPRVLDLNFRANGSTAAAWLRGAVERQCGPGSLRLRGWTCERGFDHLLRAARGAMERGALIPLCLYDPAASPSGGLPRLHGFLAGPSRETVREEERRLATEGLT